MYRIIFSAIILLMLTSSKCKKESDTCHYSILFVNNTDKDVVVHLGKGYPDTAIRYSPSPEANKFRVIPAKTSSNSALTFRYCAEGLDYFGTDSMMMVFVYDLKTLQTTPFDTIQKYYKVLKRYDLSINDLNRMNWKITYP